MTDQPYLESKIALALACERGHVAQDDQYTHCAYCGEPLSLRPILADKLPEFWRGRVVLSTINQIPLSR